MQKMLISIILIFLSIQIQSQCTNSFLFPLTEIEASSYPDTTIISTESFAGDFAIIRELSVGETYRISSGLAGDYLTIRDANDTSILLTHGPSPFDFVANLQDRIAVHINLTSPTCGTDQVSRTSTILCTSCAPSPAKVGIQTTEPRATLEVGGEILLGDAQRTPEAGMIRWSDLSNDFEGYNGENWISLTKANSSSWGTVSNAEINENEKIFPTGNEVGGDFGASIDFDGGYAIIGAPQFSEFLQPEGIGDAYIFKREGDSWIQIQKISADDGEPNDEFGYSVTISGDYLAVGARFADIGNTSNQGAVYIFKRNLNVWNQVEKLTAFDGANNHWFGSAVSLDGNTLCVGSPLAQASNNGAVYIFDRSGSAWPLTVKLSPPASANARCGSSVDVNGNYLIIGAPEADVNSVDKQGRAFVYLFSAGSWFLQNTFTAMDGLANDFFGNSVAIDMPYVVIGAQQKDIDGNINQGGAYMYEYSAPSWELLVMLEAADGSTNDYFGSAVDILGDQIVVTAEVKTENGNTTHGAAYLFEQKGTNKVLQKSKILPSDGISNGRFGYSISMDESSIFIGARYGIGLNDLQGGAVYILSKN